MVVNSGQMKRNRLQYTTWNPREGAAEVGSEMKGSGFYLAKRVSDNRRVFVRSIGSDCNPIRTVI